MKKTRNEKIISEMARFFGCRSDKIELLQVVAVSSVREEVDCKSKGVAYRVVKENGRIVSSSCLI